MNSATERKLDKIFSEAIRLRDADDNGFIRCISCQSVKRWREADNGHYIRRGPKTTRWDERNCNAQCKQCNGLQDGNKSGYTKGLIRKYGPEIIEILESTKSETTHITNSEGLELISIYKKKVAILKKQKGL